MMKHLQKRKTMKIGIFTILLLAALMCSFAFNKETVSAADSDIVYIPDKNFKAYLNEKLGVTNPNADITKAQMATINQIDTLWYSHDDIYITDITGIEYCTELWFFRLYGNETVDLSKLNTLKNLKNIEIEVKCIDDMKNITSCTGLEKLEIRGSDADIKVNFSTIGNLKNLKELRMKEIKSNNYSHLLSLKSLETLELTSSDITVLPDLSANKNLTHLDLKDCSRLEDIASLSKLTNLEYLCLNGCKAITELPSLKAMTNLEYLGLERNGIIDFMPMKGLVNLKTLEIEGVEITEEKQDSYMEAISSMINLEEIHASHSKMTDAHTSIFDNMTKLKTLILLGNDITNPNFLLKHKDRLQNLMLSGNNIPNNDILKQMKELRILGIGSTYISDFSFISQLPYLTNQYIRVVEWSTDFPTKTSEERITIGLPDYVTQYEIENNVKDEKGNYVAPVESDWYSYNASTHMITIYPDKMDVINFIKYKFTMTTNTGKTLYAANYKTLYLPSYEKPSIVSQPEELVTFLKDNFTIDMEVKGNGKMEYLWYKNGSLVHKGTTPDLVIKDVKVSDAGTYQLFMKDGYNSVTSKNIVVSVKPYTKLSGTTTINGNSVGLSSVVGNNINLNISSTGGSGNNKYSLVMTDVATGQSTTLLDNSSTNTYTGKLTSAGTKQFVVTIKDSEGNIAQTNVVTVYVYEKLAGTLTITGTTGPLSCVEGDTLTLTGSATGGDGNYMYKMSMVNADTNVSTILMGFSSTDSYSLKLNSKGTYKITLNVKDGAGNISRTTQTITVYEKVSAKLTVNGSISALEMVQGNKITLQASATGGSGTYTYQFKAYDEATGKWYTLQDFSNATSYTYKLSYKGGKKFVVTVKDNLGNQITSNYLAVNVKPLMSGKLTVGSSTEALTVNKGTSITLFATGYGGTGGYTYKFAAYDEASGKWYILKDFSASAGYTYTCNYGGKKQFAVTVKDSAGNTVATNRIYVTVNDKLSGKLTINGSTASFTKKQGSKITLNAAGFGGSGDYTYKFAVQNVDTGSWVVLRDFSEASTYDFTCNYTGKKLFAVTVKDSTGKTVATNRITVTVTK